MSRVLLRNAKLRFIGKPVMYSLLDTGDLNGQKDDIDLQYVTSNKPDIDPFIRAGFSCHRRYAMLAIDRMDEAVKIVDMTEDVFKLLNACTKTPGAQKDEFDYEVVLKVLWMDFVWLRIKDPGPSGTLTTNIDDARYKELLGMQETILREQRASLNFNGIMKLLNVGDRRAKVRKREPIERAIEVLQSRTGNHKDQVFKPDWA